jgi:hypothetical protein
MSYDLTVRECPQWVECGHCRIKNTGAKPADEEFGDQP